MKTIPIPIVCGGECCPKLCVTKMYSLKGHLSTIQSRTGLSCNQGNISLEDFMDGLISGKVFYYKNLVLFINPSFFFLTFLSCVFAFADLRLKLNKKQNMDIQEIGLGMSNKHSSFYSGFQVFSLRSHTYAQRHASYPVRK